MKRHRCRRDNTPQEINFIVVGRSRSDTGPAFRERLVHVEVHRCGCHRMFKLFRVNVVKRRLQVSPQEREHT